MNVETYWSLDTVHFFATCALFPEKLEGITLDASKMEDYIFAFEDNQSDSLLKYQQDGYFKVQILGDQEHGYRYIITDINRALFKAKLVEYLEKYREEELLKEYGLYDDSYEKSRELLYSYLRKSKREFPLVSALNMWNVWSNDRPFWEAVLAADLLDGDIRIKDVHVVKSLARGGSSLPRALVEIVKPLSQSAILDAAAQAATLKTEQVSFNKARVSIELNDGSVYWIGQNLAEGFAPLSLVKYLISHPGELIALSYAQKNIPNCSNVHQLGETLRQGFIDAKLKKLLFDECGNTEVRLKTNIMISHNELEELGLELSRGVGS